MSINFTLFFEDSFWIGLLTISDINLTKYCRILFGAEPTDIEIYNYLKTNYTRLEFTTTSVVVPERTITQNPKRRQREISRTINNSTGTKKSYDEIKKIEQWDKKKERTSKNKKEINEHQDYVAVIKKKNAKEKHRGH